MCEGQDRASVLLLSSDLFIDLCQVLPLLHLSTIRVVNHMRIPNFQLFSGEVGVRRPHCSLRVLLLLLHYSVLLFLMILDQDELLLVDIHEWLFTVLLRVSLSFQDLRLDG